MSADQAAAAATPFDRRSPSRGDARRAALLAALDDLLREGESLESITIAAITRRAGVTRSGFYFYFPNLALAVAALAESLYEDAATATRLLVDTSRPPDERLTAMVTLLFDAIDEQSARYRAVLQARTMDPTLRELWEHDRAAYAAEVARMIAAERDAGAAPPGADAGAVASLLLELNDRAVERYALGSTHRRDDQIAAVASIWLRSIYGDDPTFRSAR